MKKTQHLYDILGVSSATICVVHCLVFPFLTLLPLGLSHNPFIDLLFAITGVFAMIKIIKKSALLVTSILIVSMALIWITILAEIILDIHIDLLFTGGIGMILAHLLNYKSHQNKKH